MLTRQVHKNIFFNFLNCQAFLYYMLGAVHKWRHHLRGRWGGGRPKDPRDWLQNTLTTEKHSWTAFWKLFPGISHQVLVMCQVPGAGIWHLNFKVPGALCQVTWKYLMKERYLSNTPFLTFVYLSTCNTKLPDISGYSRIRLWTGLVLTDTYIKNDSNIYHILS